MPLLQTVTIGFWIAVILGWASWLRPRSYTKKSEEKENTSKN
jgi:hypothetical protein